MQSTKVFWTDNASFFFFPQRVFLRKKGNLWLLPLFRANFRTKIRWLSHHFRLNLQRLPKLKFVSIASLFGIAKIFQPCNFLLLTKEIMSCHIKWRFFNPAYLGGLFCIPGLKIFIYYQKYKRHLKPIYLKKQRSSSSFILT